MSNDGIAWLALGVSTVSAGTAVWALVETYRHRPRPELVVEWEPATVVNLGGGHAWVGIRDQPGGGDRARRAGECGLGSGHLR